MKRATLFTQRTSILAAFLALLWTIEAVDWLLGGTLDRYGVRPRQLGGLLGIPLAPFLHGGWAHLAANSVPLLVLGWFVLLRGVGEFLEVTVMIVLLGGLGIWLIGRPYSVRESARLRIHPMNGMMV